MAHGVEEAHLDRGDSTLTSPWGEQLATRHHECGVSPTLGYGVGAVAVLYHQKNKNSSEDEIANVNFYAVRPEATRIR